MPASTYGLIAAFATPTEVRLAAQKVRDAGYKFWDVHSPFPIHGMDAAMGLKRSIVPRYSLTGGILGFTTGMSLIAYLDGFNFPLIVDGKPLFSPLFAFPVSYELTILFTAFFTLFAMFYLNRLPMHYHPVLKSDLARRITDDGFFIVIEARDPQYSSAKAFLAEIGGKEITELEA